MSEGRISEDSTRLGNISAIGSQKTTETAHGSFDAELKRAKRPTPESLKHEQQPGYGVILTKHASLRLTERGRTLTAQDAEKISAVCEKEKEKYGANDQIGLCLGGDVFVVFPGDKRIKTVLTADGKEGTWVDGIKGFYLSK
ncbi:MAG: hypothetical protein LBB04_00295 [Oscillospiraceae bacterium]|nr:hypothetical protein [Oscillospiraceae bacterium]